MSITTLNEVFSSLSTRRRYEVWFVRLGLADGSGAWWFRYLLTNPGRGGCEGNPRGMPVQVWATWFPSNAKPQTFIEGFPVQGMEVSARGKSPFHLTMGENQIDEHSCRGELQVEGHRVVWDLQYRSSFRVVLSNKGWIGFLRTPHSDAIFSGRIELDGRRFEGNPLGFGVQGHNCGYRHRDFWTWAHAYFPNSTDAATTFEALVYEMPLGLFFRKAVLWHEGQKIVFRKLIEAKRDRTTLKWALRCAGANGRTLEVAIDGSGPSIHRLPYVKTNCAGTFEVANNSLANAALVLRRANGQVEMLETRGGAVVEMAGEG